MNNIIHQNFSNIDYFSNRTGLTRQNNRLYLISVLVDYIYQVLPAAAKRKCWSIKADHCIARVIYDNVINANWTNVISAPVYIYLTESQLIKAIEIARQMNENPKLVVELNARSLSYRSL